jgi:uncharacterized membrane protein
MKLVNGGLIILTFLVGLLLKPQLPSRLPSHWNIQGNIDGYMPTNQALWFFPALMLGMFLLFQLLPKLDPKKDKYQLFKREWEILQTVFLVFFAYIHGITLYAGIKGNVPINSLMFIGLGILFTLLGNYLSKIRQNYFIGIRVPWTLASEENWNKTHRYASWCFVAAGIFTVFDGVFVPQIAPGAAIGGIMLAGLLPIIYSFLLFKQKTKYMKVIYIALALFAAGVILIRGATGEDGWICTNTGWVKHGNPSSPAPQTVCIKAEMINKPQVNNR